MSVFKNLNSVNVNEFTEKKQKLTYLSWSHAWKEVKKLYPLATYEIKKFENNLPYVFDENTGYMIFTTVTIEDLTHEMWLFVMDGANKAMKNKSYKYTTKYGEKSVEACSMFDINKTIMRCLTKNLAMFGLGLYIYAGEDLPEYVEPELTNSEKLTAKIENLEFMNAKRITAFYKDYAKNENVITDFLNNSANLNKALKVFEGTILKQLEDTINEILKKKNDTNLISSFENTEKKYNEMMGFYKTLI